MAPKADLRSSKNLKEGLAFDPRGSTKGQVPMTQVQERQRKKSWRFDVNDAFGEELPAGVLKAFKAQGDFWEDFCVLCDAAGIVPHPSFVPPPAQRQQQQDGEGRGSVVVAGPAPVLQVRSVLIDQPNMRVAKHLLPTSLHLDTLRFSGCMLTVGDLGLLRAGLADPGCTVQTLHVDWNPLQRASASSAPEAPAQAERQRNQRSEPSSNASSARPTIELAAADRRALREFCEQLEGVHGDMDAVVRKLGFQINEITSSGVGEIVSEQDRPVDLKVWATAFGHITDIPVGEVEAAFRLLDSGGAGLVPVARLQEARALAVASDAEEESPDEACMAFAQFADATSTLESLSFRCCRLLRLEAQAIGDSLRASPHLRAINLWGNRLCNRGAAALAVALEANFGLQYLGLGRNLITHEGLEKLCQSVGYTRIDSDKQAADVQKAIKDGQKIVDKKGKAAVMKKDGRGRERYAPEPRYETCEELQDPKTGKTYWLWGRNLALKTLALDDNPITDALAVLRIRPLGPAGSNLVLRGTPCAKGLVEPAGTAEAPKGWTFVLK